jgi:protein-serine/threonine kinase
VDKRGLPVPSQSTFGSATGGMLKGLLMRRQSSQVSGETEAPSPEMAPSPVLPGGPRPGELAPEPVYGDPTHDQGDEVRFYVELTKLDGLKDTYSIDIRRLKGNLRSYKFLYDCITEYVVSSSTIRILAELNSPPPPPPNFFCIVIDASSCNGK